MHRSVWVKLVLVDCLTIVEHRAAMRTLVDTARQWCSPRRPRPRVSFTAVELLCLWAPFEISHLFCFLYLFLAIPLFLSPAITLFLFLVMVRLFCGADATWAPFYSSAPFVLFIWQASPRIVPRLSALYCRSRYRLCEALTHLRVHL